MPLLPASVFQERVSSLNTDAFRAFVADLWSARGFETRIRGAVVIAIHPDDGTARELIAVEPWDGPVDWDEQAVSEVDTFVSRADPPVDEVSVRTGQRRVFGYEEIHEMLLYSISRADAAVIARRHLDCELTVADTSASSQSSGAVRDAVATRTTWLILASALLVAVFVATATLGGPGIGFEQSSNEDSTRVSSTPAPTSNPRNTVEDSGRTAIPCPDTPTEAIEYQLNVLGNDRDVRAVWEFGTHEFRRYSGTYRDFNVSMHSHPFEHLLAPAGVTNKTVERSATTATGKVTVFDDRDVKYSYIFTLSQVDEKGTDCWRTDGLIYNQSM